MKKFLIFIISLSFCLSGCGNNTGTVNSEENSYNAERTISIDNTTESNNNDDDNSTESNNITDDNNTESNNTTDDNSIKENINTETEISSFSTKIYTTNDSARQNNLKLTCSKLNGTIVKSRRNIFILQYCRKGHP